MAVYRFNSAVLDNRHMTLRMLAAKMKSGTALQAVRSAYWKLIPNVGFGVASYAKELGRIANEMNDIGDALNELGYLLKEISEIADEADRRACAAISGVPSHVYSKVMLTGEYDFTAEFVSGTQKSLMFPRMMNVDWLDNGLGAFQKFTEKYILGKEIPIIKLGETADRKMVRESIEKLLESVTPDTGNELEEYLNTTSNGKLMELVVSALDANSYKNLKKLIDEAVATGKAISESEVAALLNMTVDEFTESDFSRLLNNQEAIKIFKETSDMLDDSLGKLEDVKDKYELIKEIGGYIFNDYTEYVEKLELIKESLLKQGYTNDELNVLVDEMIDKYKYKIGTAIERTCNEFVNHYAGDYIAGVSVMNSNAGTLSSSYGMLKVYLGIKDLAMGVTGTSSDMDKVDTIYATETYVKQLEASYYEYKQKVRSGDYTEADLSKCNQYHDLAKNAKLQQLNVMKELYEKHGKRNSDAQDYLKMIKDEIARVGKF